jgi:hypothetical protein
MQHRGNITDYLNPNKNGEDDEIENLAVFCYKRKDIIHGEIFLGQAVADFNTEG